MIPHRLVAVLLAATLGTAAACWAKPSYLGVLERAYPGDRNSALAKARCLACHAPPAPPILNAFGAQVQAGLRQAGAAGVTEDVLRSIGPADADGDGASNGAELAAGTLPGDSASRPVGAAGVPGGGSRGRALERTVNLGAAFLAVPDHSFHPLLVHFPIGLYVFGALLEMTGARRRRPDLLSAGFLNRCAGAACAVPTVATGAMAFWRSGYTFTGLPPLHLATGICAATLMLASVAAGLLQARQGKPRAGTLYWTLLWLAFAAVALAGHLGSLLVHS